MGEHIVQAMAGQRGGWQGNGPVNIETLNQAVLTAVLTGVIESMRTPLVLVPNVGAAQTSRLGGDHIGKLVEGLPLSGKVARNNIAEMVAKFGADSYEVVGGQRAGRQTEWLLAVRRASGATTYFDTSAGFSASGAVGKGYLKPVQITKRDHPAPHVAALTRQFQIPAVMVQNAYNLDPTEKRVNLKLWEKVGAEINANVGPDIKPPSKASEEVLRRTAANMKLWADAMGLDYSKKNAADAKAEFLLRIWHELTGMFGLPADPAFEQRLRRNARG
jgi:hypothetical protein